MPATRRSRATTSKQSSGGSASTARPQSAASSRPRDYVDRSKLPPPPREVVTTWARFHDRETFKYFMREHYKRAEREEIRKMHEERRKENEARRIARLEEQSGTKAAPAVDVASPAVAASDPPTSSSSSSIPSSGQRRGRRAGRGRRHQQQQGEPMPSSAASTPGPGPSNDSRGGNNNGKQAAPDASAQPRIVDRRPPAGLTPVERHQFAKQFMDPRSLAARRTSWPNEFVASGSSLFGGAWQIA